MFVFWQPAGRRRHLDIRAGTRKKVTSQFFRMKSRRAKVSKMRCRLHRCLYHSVGRGREVQQGISRAAGCVRGAAAAAGECAKFDILPVLPMTWPFFLLSPHFTLKSNAERPWLDTEQESSIQCCASDLLGRKIRLHSIFRCNSGPSYRSFENAQYSW